MTQRRNNIVLKRNQCSRIQVLGAAFVVAVDGVVGSRASATLRHHQRYRARRCCWRRCLFGGENSRLVRREVVIGGRPGCQDGHGFLRCCCFALCWFCGRFQRQWSMVWLVWCFVSDGKWSGKREAGGISKSKRIQASS